MNYLSPLSLYNKKFVNHYLVEQNRNNGEDISDDSAREKWYWLKENKVKSPHTSKDQTVNDSKIVIKVVPAKQTNQYQLQKKQSTKYISKLSQFDKDFNTDNANRRQGFVGPQPAGIGLVGGALLVILPLIIMAGISIVYYTSNGYTIGGLSLALPSGSSSSRVGNTVTGSINNTNIININGTTLTNTFTPTNDDTNNNALTDSDTITNTNDNTTPAPRKRRAIANNLEQILLKIMGVSKEQFAESFMKSANYLNLNEMIGQSTSLSRKISCLKTSEESLHCLDRMICEHFAEDHLVYDGNMLMRLSQIWTASMMKTKSVELMSDIMDNAVREECEIKYDDCRLGKVKEECLNII